MSSKSEIRKQMLNQRLAMTPLEVSKKSAMITSRLLSLTEYQEADTILIYASCKNEVATQDIIKDALEHNKVVGVPKSYDEGIMKFYSIFDYGDLKPGRYNIPEPPEDILITPQNALLIVPGVAFDIHKNRIGYGGGYYDRYMKQYPQLDTVGLAYDFQILDAIEVEETDRTVDFVITQRQIIV